MPSEGLRVDIELLMLVITAGLMGYLLTDQFISNALLSGLLTALFFLIGLQIEPGILKNIRLKPKQMVLGLSTVFVVAPATAFIFGTIVPEFLDILLVIGISAAGISSARIWSNMTNSDGDLAHDIGVVSLFTAFLAIPVLIAVTGLNIDYSVFASNALIPLTALFVGITARNIKARAVSDLRYHFSKASFWLITLITVAQTHLIFLEEGFSLFYTFLYASLVFMGFTLACFGIAYLLTRITDIYKKEARAIAFSTGSKNVAIAFFIALHIDGLAVALVGLYYFVRQLTGLVAVDLMVHGEFRAFKRLVLKASSPLGKLRVNK